MTTTPQTGGEKQQTHATQSSWPNAELRRSHGSRASLLPRQNGCDRRSIVGSMSTTRATVATAMARRFGRPRPRRQRRRRRAGARAFGRRASNFGSQRVRRASRGPRPSPTTHRVGSERPGGAPDSSPGAAGASNPPPGNLVIHEGGWWSLFSPLRGKKNDHHPAAGIAKSDRAAQEKGEQEDTRARTASRR